jgi:chloramphenicol 3-O phosphotransferase
MNADIVVLNGGSSSGKTSLGRCLQELLPVPWLMLGVDDLIAAMPGTGDESMITFAPDGTISVGPGFRRLEAGWYEAIAAMARSGVGVIVDEVFLDGGRSQARLRQALSGLAVLWVGVRCDPAVAAAREAGRKDRVPGMAASQADAVHQGVYYDIEVDTMASSALECAQRIRDLVMSPGW